MIRIHTRVSWVLLLSVFLACSFSSKKANAQYDQYVSYNDFYENLAPYGQWIEDPQYGNVWSPNESGSFRPYYTNGHWVMTEYGNTWVSDYAWGWACFHYGRWTYDPYYGWLWIPGQDWGPAWVSWRGGEGYYGWAPLGPNYTDFGADYSCPNDWWVFIPPQYMYTGNYYHYWYGPRGNSKIIHNTNFINHTFENNHVTYVSGPRSNEIEGITHQPVQVYHLANSTNMNTRTSNNVVKMYRPARIAPAATMGGQKVTPPNVVSAPQPVRSAPQPVSTGQSTPTQFKDVAPKNVRTETPGTNYNQTATPAAPQRGYNNNPYEYDVNRPVQQPSQTRQENAPQPTRSEPMQQQQQPVRQMEQPTRQMEQARPQAQPQQSAPQPMRQMQAAPQQAAPMRAAPAQAQPARGGAVGGRR